MRPEPGGGDVGVLVGVDVGTLVDVEVGVAVGIDVGVFTGVAVGLVVGVGTGVPPVVKKFGITCPRLSTGAGRPRAYM